MVNIPISLEYQNVIQITFAFSLNDSKGRNDSSKPAFFRYLSIVIFSLKKVVFPDKNQSFVFRENSRFL